MKKFVVETYYTCTFKTVHTLDDLNDKENKTGTKESHKPVRIRKNNVQKKYETWK